MKKMTLIFLSMTLLICPVFSAENDAGKKIVMADTDAEVWQSFVTDYLLLVCFTMGEFDYSIGPQLKQAQERSQELARYKDYSRASDEYNKIEGLKKALAKNIERKNRRFQSEYYNKKDLVISMKTGKQVRMAELLEDIEELSKELIGLLTVNFDSDSAAADMYSHTVYKKLLLDTALQVGVIVVPHLPGKNKAEISSRVNEIIIELSNLYKRDISKETYDDATDFIRPVIVIRSYFNGDMLREYQKIQSSASLP